MSYDLRRFPPPGKRIDVGGYKLHLYCTGEKISGKPTVILEGGTGAPSLMWSLTQPEIAKQARVCSYDRAGYAWSEPSPHPRTADNMIRELHDLLQLAGETPPYILAGHSLGGILIRLYAAEYPADVAGLILVDARHEDFFQRMPPEYLTSDENNFKRAKQLKWMTPLGMTRLAGMNGMLGAFEAYLSPLPDDAESAARALMLYNPNHWSTAVAEREALDEIYRQVKLTRLPPDLPLVVLTAENGVEAWRSSVSPADAQAKATWMQMQKELSQLSRQSEWIILKDCGHYIYFDQPAAIVAAASALLEQ